MRTPEDYIKDDVVQEPPRKGFFSKLNLFKKKEKKPDPLNMDAEMQEYFKSFVEQRKAEERAAASQPHARTRPRIPPASMQVHDTRQHTPATIAEEQVVVPPVVEQPPAAEMSAEDELIKKIQVPYPQPSPLPPQQPQQQRFDGIPQQIPPTKIQEAQKIVDDGTVEYISVKSATRLSRAINAGVLGVSFIVGIVGVNVVYTNLPTYPMVTVGIVAIAMSAGIITSMAR